MEKTVLNDNTNGTTENTKCKTKMRGKKRKRRGSNSSSESEDNSLPENALEVEKNVIASAVKNNLDDVSVKKILKKVVTNDHVLALVKLREEEEEESSREESGVRPKLTRAKVKELMKVSPKTHGAPWNLDNIELTPIKHIQVKTRPEVTALLAQELPEDEDDEEYKPSQDDVPSDDDQGLESCSDLDSQPRTPATPRSLNKSSPKVVNDGPFKVPLDLSTSSRRKLNLDNEEEATIALRTRSKLCLSETPIEHIESSFVPPDDLPMPPVVDHLWNEFLNECLNPASVSRNEDDDETDPEYNVAADQDAHDEDEEALENSIIKISKKELNDLVTELFNIMPEETVENELDVMANSIPTGGSRDESRKRWEGKEEPLSDDDRPLTICEKLTFERRDSVKMSIGKTEPMDHDDVEKNADESAERRKEESESQKDVVVKPRCNVVLSLQEEMLGVQPAPEAASVPPPPLQTQPAVPGPQVISAAVILPEQVLILQQQLRQHIQLATSNFLQLYIHPLHWMLGPTYKEYLETLMKIAEENPSSVVDVCNLRPAVDLIHSWEKTVSQDTPENTAMVEFIQKEADRWRRGSANNSLYLGQFHATFLQVVAGSSVFLYPYLLPAMPFRADTNRRSSYLRSEDELIALGLDQFWQYVEDNPQLYPPPTRPHPRHRWGLTATTTLVVRHMMPWLSPKTLTHHVQTARRQGDKDNAINKFFANREVVPVKHRLLPYNPKLTLYEQPEHEMPRLWLRYLAKTSKRFRSYMRRRSDLQGQTPPAGVEVEIGSRAVCPIKEPLPTAFTKEIRSARIHSTPLIQDQQTPLNFYKLVQTDKGATLVPLKMIDPTSSNVITAPRSTIEIDNLNITVLPATTAVQTNTGSSNAAPITTAFETQAEKTSDNKVEPEITDLAKETSKITVENNHCTCCVLLRKICKVRQTVITDFFKSKNVTKFVCPCRDKKYPNVTNRLKLLVRRYKSNGTYIYDEIQKKLKISKAKHDNNYEELHDASEADRYNIEDVAFVNSFQMKLTIRSMIARNIHTKKRINNLLRSFRLDWDDPVKLANQLDETFAVEMVDVSKEFVGFLNPVQAASIRKFRDYFIQNCVEKLVNEIEVQVTDEPSKRLLLLQINEFFSERPWSPCSMCTTLLKFQRKHPSLARYTFSLFPHIHDSSKKTTATKERIKSTIELPKTIIEPTPVITSEPVNQEDIANNTLTNDEPHAAMDYEADDDSSSGEENGSDKGPIEGLKLDEQKHVTPAIIQNDTTAEAVIDTPELTISKTEVQDCESSDMSMMIMSEDELIKPEPLEWKREEDKLILEMLKQHLTPEERKEKTIIETIEDKQIVNILTDSLTDKSIEAVKERVLNILKLLVLGES